MYVYFMVYAKINIKVNLDKEVLKKYSLNDNNFFTQHWLHRFGLKGFKMNSEVTSMNFFRLQEINC